MQRILAVDDNPDILEVVGRELTKRGYEVASASDGERAVELIDGGFSPDLAILDIIMPGMSGKDLLHALRERLPGLPVIFLSGLDADYDRIGGLETGADDYITKPFLAGELLARVRAVLRRSTGPHVAVTTPAQPEENVLVHGGVKADRERHLCFADNSEVELTKIEFDMLCTLMRRPTKVYTRDEIMLAVWGPGVYVAERTINSHMRRLREKLLDALGYDAIETVRGVGYRMKRVEVIERESAQAATTVPID